MGGENLYALSLSVLHTEDRLLSILVLRVRPELTAMSFSISLTMAKHPSQNRTGSSRLDFSALESTARTWSRIIEKIFISLLH